MRGQLCTFWWCSGKAADLQKTHFLELPLEAELQAPAFQAKTPMSYAVHRTEAKGCCTWRNSAGVTQA